MRTRTFVTAAAIAVALLGTGGAAASAAGGKDVPPAVQVPPGNVLVADMLGRGVQVYQCTNGAWVFLEPAANLAGWAKSARRPATAVHFRGPSWESTDDGSLVEARVVASSPVPGAVAQLLLQATKNRGGGVFGDVTFIQRLDTRGGLAPAGACVEGATVGVPYTADYRFFQAG